MSSSLACELQMKARCHVFQNETAHSTCTCACEQTHNRLDENIVI